MICCFIFTGTDFFAKVQKKWGLSVFFLQKKNTILIVICLYVFCMDFSCPLPRRGGGTPVLPRGRRCAALLPFALHPLFDSSSIVLREFFEQVSNKCRTSMGVKYSKRGWRGGWTWRRVVIILLKIENKRVAYILTRYGIFL